MEYEMVAEQEELRRRRCYSKQSSRRRLLSAVRVGPCESAAHFYRANQRRSNFDKSVRPSTVKSFDEYFASFDRRPTSEVCHRPLPPF